MRFSSTYEELFYKALTIRLVEERIIEIYPSDKIQSPVHLSIGQEAVAVGVCQSLRPADLLFTSYRSHAFYLAKGGNLKEMFAELFRESGGAAVAAKPARCTSWPLRSVSWSPRRWLRVPFRTQ